MYFYYCYITKSTLFYHDHYNRITIDKIFVILFYQYLIIQKLTETISGYSSSLQSFFFNTIQIPKQASQPLSENPLLSLSPSLFHIIS